MSQPTKNPAWAEFDDEKLLEVRVCDLSLTIEGTEIQPRVEELWQELGARGIVFMPECYLADEWFCPDGVPIIAIPFYLAHTRLKQLEQRMMLEVEGGTKDSCMRLLRHECGHAINYAYLLHRRAKWRELFGSFSTEYPDTYKPMPYSRRYVRHLENWYAQYHPDEDFAETFAVWLDPASNWKERYSGWSAMAKLEYVDALMAEIAGLDPKVRGCTKMCEAAKLRQRLSYYYRCKQRRSAEDMPGFYDSDLRRIFAESSLDPKAERASAFLKRNRSAIVGNVSKWTGEKKFTVNRLLRSLADRCHELKNYRKDDEATTLMQVTAFLTYMTMNYIFTGRPKRHP